MMDYEQMAKLVLGRIQAERPPKWKLILSAIWKRIVLFILVVLIVTLLTVLAVNRHSLPANVLLG